MTERTLLGARHVCFVCSCRFYDMNQEAPKCPECKADQRKSPTHYARNELGKGGTRQRRRRTKEPLPEASDHDEDDD